MTGPEGPEVLGTQISRHLTHEGSKVVTPYEPAAFTPQKIFLVEAELTPGGHSVVTKIMPMKNYSNTIRNWTHDRSVLAK